MTETSTRGRTWELVASGVVPPTVAQLERWSPVARTGPAQRAVQRLQWCMRAQRIPAATGPRRVEAAILVGSQAGACSADDLVPGLLHILAGAGLVMGTGPEWATVGTVTIRRSKLRRGGRRGMLIGLTDLDG